MTSLQAKQLVLAQRRMKQAQTEFKAARLRETRYRGVPTIITETNNPEVHCTCVYRGIAYQK